MQTSGMRAPASQTYNYYWRLAVTGVSFLLFSAGGALISLAFPAVYLLPGGAARREQRARWMISKFFGLLVALLKATGVMRLQTHGVERLRRAGGVLVLANHPSLIDVVVLLSTMPRATCVVKAALWANPFVAGAISAAGYIRNSSSPEQVIDDCDRALRNGAAVIIFPEGTRTRPNEPLKFLRGAAHVALKNGWPIVPVLLTCDPPTLTKGSCWYEIPERPFSFRVMVRDELSPAHLADLRQPPVLAARSLTHALESYFSRELRTP